MNTLLAVAQHPVPHHAPTWPQGCRYYDGLLMNSAAILKLLQDDTCYFHEESSWSLDYTYTTPSGPVHCNTQASDDHDNGIFAPSVLQSSLTVVQIRQKRIYLQQGTYCGISVSLDTWKQILQRFDVLPNFLEVLHSNNGGSLSWTSYAEDSKGAQQPVAFHAGYKMGDWANDEIAVYIRRDLQTGQSFVLIMGTDNCLCRERIPQLLSDNPTATIFHIAFLVHATTIDLTEKIRWDMDYRTQDLETLTGVATLRPLGGDPLPASELRFNKDLQVATDFTRNVAWGSQRVRFNFEALAAHLDAYERLCPPGTPHALPSSALHNLRDAIDLKISLAKNQYDQIQCLLTRLDSQAAITKTLMAERDTEISITIAQATRRDSELMRGIAAVTMVFLPATFVATFFSMVFFHVGDEEDVWLLVDSRVWLYPVVTVPLTAFIAVWYFAWSVGLSWKDVRAKAVALVGK